MSAHARRGGRALLLLLSALLIGCGAPAVSSPTKTPAPPTPTAVATAPGPAPAPTADATDIGVVSWEGLRFPVPPAHRWEPARATDVDQRAQVLSQGRITFVPTQASHPVEQPDGIGLTIVRFSGTGADWLAQEAQPANNPIDRASIRTASAGGRTAQAYSRTVIGVSRSERVAVPLGGDRLLLIDISDADNQDYSAWLEALAIAN